MKYKNICGQDFERKNDAYQYFRNLVNQTANGAFEIILTENTPLKKSHIQYLVDNYIEDKDWLKRKTNNKPIVDYMLQLNEHQSDYHLCFIMEGEKPEPITAKKYFTCFGKGTISDEEKLISAMRHAIQAQINAFRQNDLRARKCSRCPNPNDYVIEIHHRYPFKKIVEDFFTKFKGWKEFLIKSLYKRKGNQYWEFQHISPDEDFYPGSPVEEWLYFHEEKAVYEALCKNCHKAETYCKVIN
jgi:hypothetical protein